MKKLYLVFFWGTLIGTLLFIAIIQNSLPVFIFKVSFTIFIILFIISIILVIAKENSQKKFIKYYQFPEKLDEKILYMYPYLSKEDLNCVKQELRNFFKITKECQPETIAMPSRIVDISWHEFILHTKDYQNFCRRAFGHYFHHNPFSKETTSPNIKISLQRAWIYSCKSENIEPKSPRYLPILFSIDATLNIPDGNKFKIRSITQDKSHLECTHGSYAGLGAIPLVAGIVDDRGGESGGCGGGGCG